MANASTPARQDVDHQQSAEVATITNKQLLAQFAEMATMIPAELEDGTEAILARILSAETWDDLDAPWETSSVEDILGKTLRIEKVTRRPSTFKGGLGMFLVVTLKDHKTGDTYIKTTGSVAIVGQIAAAYAKGWMPVEVEWMQAERPTENGYYPQHLRITDSFAP